MNSCQSPSPMLGVFLGMEMFATSMSSSVQSSSKSALRQNICSGGFMLSPFRLDSSVCVKYSIRIVLWLGFSLGMKVSDGTGHTVRHHHNSERVAA